MAKLTDIAIRNLKPRATRYEVPDTGCAGLYCIVQPVTGRKRFAVRYRANGRSTKFTLPPGIGLAAARAMAADTMLAVSQGKDPAAEKQEAKNRTSGAAASTLAHVVTKYYQDPRVKTLRSAFHTESMLRRNVLPVFGARPIASIKRSELLTLNDELITTRGERTADATLKVLGAVCHWWELRDPDETFRSPIVRGMSSYRAHEHRRKRVLDDSEIALLWQATAEPTIYHRLVRFLLTTGARRGEVSGMRWDELTGDVWVLPASRDKTGEGIERPLSKLALSILDEVPRVEGNPWVFSLNSRPFNSHPRFKQRLDDQLRFAEPFVLHDLRRVVRSLLSRAGIANDISEMCLGHAVQGIRAVYDRFKYIEQNRHAFAALASLIERIVDPTPAEKVVALRG